MSKKGLLSVFLLSLLSLIFVSCSNFMEGKEFLDELQNVINYNSKSFVKITIDAPNSYTESISPAVGEYSDKYKCGDSFTLSYIPNEDYNFLNWVVEPEGAVTFEDSESAVTQVTIAMEGEIKISPVCTKALKVISSSPSLSDGEVNRASDIKITFNLPLDKKSVYWTKEEIFKEVADLGYTKLLEEKKYDDNIINYTVSKADNENDYVILYSRTDLDVDVLFCRYQINNEIYYKNIEIYNYTEEKSISNCYSYPQFLNNNYKELYIYSSTDRFNNIPKNINIEYKIKNFTSTEGGRLKKEYSSIYKVGEMLDTKGPKFTIYDETANTNTVNYFTGIYGKREYSYITNGKEWNFISEDKISEEEASAPTFCIEDLNEQYHIYDTKTVTIKNPFSLDDESGVKKIKLTLKPIKNSLYPEQTDEVYVCNYATSYSFGVSNFLSFDLSEFVTEGLFEITIEAMDIYDKSTTIPLKEDKPLVTIVDNIFSGEISLKTQRDPNDRTKILGYKVTGPKGKYLLVSGGCSQSASDDFNVERALSSVVTTDFLVLQNDETIGADITKKTKSMGGTKVKSYLIAEDIFGNITYKIVTKTVG